ncbi:hypothetical protein BZG36_00138 [Bifiguratus adelaidae]|uniref:Uncharacterized protein n=1 Tax=Bifiguratus adelaidae TaxID=1938954 RepID=A0A261Y8J3_9FUNG|nr:hypothetical protein BZG36_00138 [Bifiguratus adelaidae]
MFGCIVAGRLVQTNLQQVDVNKWIFELPEAASINHIVVFLLGTIPFEPGNAATVHFLWPGKDWHLLGMLSNEKPSAIFRLKGKAIPTSDGTANVNITATVGISIEPKSSVQTQMSALTSTHQELSGTSGALVLRTQPSESETAAIATKLLQNLFNFVTSFAQNTVPPGEIGLMSQMSVQNTWLPLKVFQQWYDNLGRKIKADPNYLLKDNDV